ncbi:MAG TPA: DUF3078 domain-containing protein [Flavobacterium sp.]|nr:DUF3078 domain-containing protein [Flavobacterium sp.]
MKIFRDFFSLFILLASMGLMAQPTDALIQIRESIKVDKDTVFWEEKNIVGLDLTQIAFVNWSAGGNTSISGLLKGNATRKYTSKHIIWNNELIVRYGINKQEGRELRKTDDVFSVHSNFGYKKFSDSNWFYSARSSFNTQFTNGYSYPNTDIAISKPFAPAYFFLGGGTEYNRKDLNLNFYFSPFTLKTTFVMDRRLANLGSFGVTKATYDEEGNLLKKGRKTRNEFGILLSNYWKYEFYKNMFLENRLSVYSDYINKFGNIDIDWQVQVDMVVNQYVRANVSLHMIYDDDIKAKEEINGEQVTVGPKLQLKQALGIGVVYQF